MLIAPVLFIWAERVTIKNFDSEDKTLNRFVLLFTYLMFLIIVGGMLLVT